MTIDLGFAWTTLPSGRRLAFVDVPGHERFVPNMLAGVGPVPAVLFVVAADEGWMPQSAEHLAALDALDVRHGLLVVTRSDLADPAPRPWRRPRNEIAATSLGRVEAVAVSGTTGAGLDCTQRRPGPAARRPCPAPDAGADVRLWIDRSFTVRGSGSGGHRDPRGRDHRGPATSSPSRGTGARVRVRGLQSLGEPAAGGRRGGPGRGQPARRTPATRSAAGTRC